MIAETFFKKIKELESLLSLEDSVILKSIFEKNLLSLNLDSLEQEKLYLSHIIEGTRLTKKIKFNENYKNEIENLIENYNLSDLWKLIEISFAEEIVNDEEFYIFGFLDSHLAYDTSNKVYWLDQDDFKLLSNVAASDELFLECLYILAENLITKNLSSKAILAVVVNQSQTDSILFWSYLLGIEPLE